MGKKWCFLYRIVKAIAFPLCTLLWGAMMCGAAEYCNLCLVRPNHLKMAPKWWARARSRTPLVYLESSLHEKTCWHSSLIGTFPEAVTQPLIAAMQNVHLYTCTLYYTLTLQHAILSRFQYLAKFIVTDRYRYVSCQKNYSNALIWSKSLSVRLRRAGG